MSAFDVAGHLGYLILPLTVGAEGAGAPIPGEATLIAAAVLAAHGHMSIDAVIALAAGGAAAGDSLGYVLGRRLGRRVLLARGPGRRVRGRALDYAGLLVERFGAGAVFIGRFVGVGRIAVAWMAGAGNMPWRRFAVCNVAACVVWASLVGGLAYAVGSAGARWVAVGGAVLTAAAVARVAWRTRRERPAERASPNRPCCAGR